jgi:hypothetical protein
VGPFTLPLAALLFYSGAFFIGLVNFIFGLALTLWLVGGWVTHECWRKRLALAVLGAGAVFFCHLLAALTFVGILLCLELHAGLSMRSWDAFRRATSPVAFGLVVVLLLLSPSSGHAFEPGWHGAGSLETLLRWKATIFGTALLGGAIASDVVVLIGGTAFLLILPLTCRLSLHGRPGFVVLGLLAATLLLPERVGLGSLIDFRLGLMPIVFAAATVRMTQRRSGAPGVAFAALVALVAVRTAVLVAAWLGAGDSIASIDRAAAALPRESVLLAALGTASGEISWADRWAPSLTNIVTIGALRGLFVPTVFAFSSQHPLVLRPEWRELAADLRVHTSDNLREVSQLARASCEAGQPIGVLILHPGPALEVAGAFGASLAATGDRFAMLGYCASPLAAEAAGRGGVIETR